MNNDALEALYLALNKVLGRDTSDLFEVLTPGSQNWARLAPIPDPYRNRFLTGLIYRYNPPPVDAPPAPVVHYNHMAQLGFTINSDLRSGDDLTPADYRRALNERIRQLGDDPIEWWEAIALDDTLEVKGP